MPHRAPSRNGDLTSIADTGRGSEFRRTSRHHQPSRFAKETPLSPRASQNLKFKDKGARTENPVRLPNARLPLEFLKHESSKDELVKYMSKVPGYLQKGEKIQDSVLNFGVLDWGRLEKWTHKESQSSTSHTGSSVDFSPAVKPMTGKVTHRSDVAASSSTSKKHVNYRKDKVRAVGVELKSAKDNEMDRKLRDGVDLKSAKGKEKCLYQESEVSGRSNKEPDNANVQQKMYSEQSERREIDCSNKQDSIVLLLPKDFSRPCSSELPRKAAFHAKSGQHNWGSFSDLFSIDEIHADESFTDIPPSCSADPVVETEKDLDLKLDTLIKAQGVERLDKPPQESSIHQRFGFGLAKMTRSLSLKESSIHPPLNSMYVTAKSGPAKTEGPLNVHAKARSNPFKRLLDPILKPKVVNHTKKQSNDSTMDPHPPVPSVVPEVEKCQALTIKALLHLTVKSGLPLFKFVVETNNEIFASTVKSLSSLNKDEISLMYTFYSVHKIRKKTSGWKNQKGKPCRYGYDVVGQMKVSKESVLYSVDVSKSDAATCEIVTGREIAAIVVNNLKDEKLAQTVVILPGGDHSQPHEGVASSLINRWRTGGLCDCGGWDEGCKLRILADLEDRRGQLCSRSGLMDIRCDLYDQGESKESSPLFRLVPFRDGLYSVEFDPKMSSMQAFSICVAVISNKQATTSSDAHQVESKHEFGAARTSLVAGEGLAAHHPHPPASPVGRV